MVYGLWLYDFTFMVKFTVFGRQVRAKMELVSIWARKYSFGNYFFVKGERKFVYFSYFFTTFGEFFFVKGTFSCESAICITLSIVYKGIVYKGGFWAVLKILGKLRVPSTQALLS